MGSMNPLKRKEAEKSEGDIFKVPFNKVKMPFLTKKPKIEETKQAPKDDLLSKLS